MEARHLVMIAMGGVIGSGLFVSSGYTISTAGPLGAVIAFLIGAVVVYLVMACLGGSSLLRSPSQVPSTFMPPAPSARLLALPRPGCTGSAGLWL